MKRTKQIAQFVTLEETLSAFGHSLKNLKEIGTDNSSRAMEYVKTNTEINLLLIRCGFHSLQLSVSAIATEALPNIIDH